MRRGCSFDPCEQLGQRQSVFIGDLRQGLGRAGISKDAKRLSQLAAGDVPGPCDITGRHPAAQDVIPMRGVGPIDREQRHAGGEENRDGKGYKDSRHQPGMPAHDVTGGAQQGPCLSEWDDFGAQTTRMTKDYGLPQPSPSRDEEIAFTSCAVPHWLTGVKLNATQTFHIPKHKIFRFKRNMLVELSLESYSDCPRVPSSMREERQDLRYAPGGPFRLVDLDGCSAVAFSEAVG
ncbi:hypothetical protein ACEUZ9_000391 [Paracoccus litorisediminis]|uniref:hypothetical protein n=1 Tax=Paracoccus litorisediminis TaxID=2006130 RepID=UPI003732089A